jgi:hypothetical protein
MDSLIHEELAQLAGDEPAAYITTQSFSRLTLDRITKSTDLLIGKEIPAGTGQLSASLNDVKWANVPALSLVPSRRTENKDREVDIVITSSLTAIVEIFITGNRAAIVSELRLSLTDIRVHLQALGNKLLLEGTDFSAARAIQRNKDAEDLLKTAGVDLLEAARVEGHLSYGVLSQAVSSALAKRSEISLTELFPAFDFGTNIALHPLLGGDALGIIPTSAVSMSPEARCICSEGPDYKLGQSGAVSTSPSDAQPNDEIGKVTIGGAIPDNKDPLTEFGLRYESIHGGAAGVYVPQLTAQSLVARAMPAVKIVASDAGVIGYRAEANVGFKNLRVSFDIPGGGILLDIDLDISVSAYCDFEIFKGFRVPIGWAIVQPANGTSSASLQIGFYPSVNSSGSVRLKSTLKKSDMGQYVAVVIGIGTALKIFGVTWWIGFLIDVVLATILATGLPIALKKAIGDQVNHGEWKLIDGLQVLDPTKSLSPSAPFHAKSTSILASVSLKG